MFDFVKKRWVLFLVLAVFVICKIPHLNYPYYWDESWPYLPAIKELYKHGISLMPDAINAEISRGHPLFFHVIAVIWMHIFGGSHISMHSFALFISVLFLVAIYEVGLKLFNERVAIMSLILVATQVVFFVQASFVLFEILVAFLVFLSLYFYVRDKYLLTVLCLTALFYTKESGLILGFVLGSDAFLGLFKKGKDLRRSLFRVLSVFVPCLLIGAYFLIQKQVKGWYIFPFYNQSIERKWLSIWYNFRRNSLRNTFWEYYKYYYFLLLLALSAVAAFKNKNYKYLVPFLPGILIYLMIDDKRSVVFPSKLFFLLFLSSVVIMLYGLKQLKFYVNDKQERFILLSCAFIFCFFCFSSLNFFSYRYLLAAFIPLFFFTAVLYDKLIERSYPVLFYPVLLAVLAIAFFAFKYDENNGDTDIGAFDGMAVQQDMVNYFEQNNLYDKKIGSNSFMQWQHFTNPATGFLHSDKVFKNIGYDINAETDYAIFDNVDSDVRYEMIKKDTAFHRVHRFQRGKVWNEIYQRNR